tara:strand:- start:411 stop:821 length:411 start_codon:yes stop_codon:yes gene_type:complete
MSVRIVRTRSGEDIICDIREIMQEGDQQNKVLGYQLTDPYFVYLSEEMTATDDEGNIHKISNPQITMVPWAPLAKERFVIVRFDEVIAAYETHDDVLNKYNQLTEAQSGRGNDAGATESNPVETEIGISVGEGDGA